MYQFRDCEKWVLPLRFRINVCWTLNWIYIYIDRERERERWLSAISHRNLLAKSEHTPSLSLSIYIYIYIHIYINIACFWSSFSNRNKTKAQVKTGGVIWGQVMQVLGVRALTIIRCLIYIIYGFLICTHPNCNHEVIKDYFLYVYLYIYIYLYKYIYIYTYIMHINEVCSLYQETLWPLR